MSGGRMGGSRIGEFRLGEDPDVDLPVVAVDTLTAKTTIKSKANAVPATVAVDTTDAETTVTAKVNAKRATVRVLTILPVITGERILPDIDLSRIGVWHEGRLKWDATEPSQTEFSVFVSKDDGETWTEVSQPGDLISIFSEGDDVLGEVLKIMQQFKTSDPALTNVPTLKNFRVQIESR